MCLWTHTVMVLSCPVIYGSCPSLGQIRRLPVFLIPLCAAQFTELQQKEQLAKLAMARSDLAAAPSARKFKFVSGVNEQVSLGSCSCRDEPRSLTFMAQHDCVSSCRIAVA